MSLALLSLGACATTRRIRVADGYLDLVLPFNYTRHESHWFEGTVISFAPSGGLCAPVIEITFYGGFGAGMCGPRGSQLETDTLAGQSWPWSVGVVDGPKCGHRLWRRAPLLDGDIILIAAPEEMPALRAALASAVWNSPDGPLGFSQHDAEHSRWSFDPGICE